VSSVFKNHTFIMSLTIKPPSPAPLTRFHLGEVMLRLDPGEGRIRTARHFHAWEGGGEYNTSRGLRKCFGYKTAVCTAFVDTRSATSSRTSSCRAASPPNFIKWREDDGIGRTVRNGLNFTPSAASAIRGAVGNPDAATPPRRSSSPAISTGTTFRPARRPLVSHRGIFAALSASTAEITVEAVKAAKQARQRSSATT